MEDFERISLIEEKTTVFSLIEYIAQKENIKIV